MDMYVELTKALVEMVKSGGAYAIGGLAIWLFLNILKTGLVLWVVVILGRGLLQTVSNWLTLKQVTRQEHIVLLSRKTSARLESILGDYRDSMSKAMKEFIAEAKGALQQSKGSQKK